MSWPETVRKSDLRIDFYRGSGKGGQHRNKTDSACRLTHLPTGRVAQCEEERSQHLNRAKAFRRLANQLAPMMIAAQKTEVTQKHLKTIRTYHEQRRTVKDHRTGKVYPLGRVMDGKELEAMQRDVATASQV